MLIRRSGEHFVGAWRVPCITNSVTSMTDEYRPHYKWRETWAGEGRQDFEGFDGEQRFGRIQLDIAGSGTLGMWKWNTTHIPWVRKHVMVQSGWEDSAREAARMAEEHYDRLKELHGLRS